MKFSAKTTVLAEMISAMMSRKKKAYVKRPGAGVARAVARMAKFRKDQALRLKDAMAVMPSRQMQRSFAIRGR